MTHFPELFSMIIYTICIFLYILLHCSKLIVLAKHSQFSKLKGHNLDYATSSDIASVFIDEFDATVSEFPEHAERYAALRAKLLSCHKTQRAIYLV